jgi:myo-inositol-1(or 4)-monophosphatase
LADDDLSAERERLIAAVREGGTLALKTFRGSPKQWAKGLSSVVCEADLAVDALLKERLAGGFGWLSEETEDDPARLDAARTWVVDPIDGTRAYLAGREDWCVAAALVVGGRPVLAAIFAPVTDELFIATAGAGATCNGVPMAASEGERIGGANAAGPKKFLNWLAAIDPDVIAVPRIGSLALRLTRVAQGTIDIAFAGGNSHDWDLAAADLLVHEAGGAMTTLAGQPLTYNRPEPVHGPLIAAGRARHAALLALVRDRSSRFV